MRTKHSVALLALGIAAGSLVSPAVAADRTRQVQAQTADSEFARLALRLGQRRLEANPEDEKLQEQALSILDAAVLAALNTPGEPDLQALNQRLAAQVVAQPPLGEDFRVTRLPGRSGVYALATNFSLAGPSAIRIYTSFGGRSALAARIDRFAQKDFFDEYLELVPVAAGECVFVTVTGRTDELQTGAFTAWLFDGTRVRALWSSEILPQSSYESGPDGFRLAYCAETDDDNPRICRQMVRDRYAWDGAAWKRVEQTTVPVPKR